MKWLKRICIVWAVCLCLTGCEENNSAGADASGDKLNVYTSFYTMYDFAEKIGGDRIILTNLIPTGTEPHDWEPSTGDMVALGEADVFVCNGAGMEPWLDKVQRAVTNENLVTIETGEKIHLLENEEDGHDDHDHGDLDPHVWLNPLYAKEQLRSIAEAFCEADPENRDYYMGNYEKTEEKLDELDRDYREAVEQFSKREIIVAHQAYGYLCEAYGLTQIAIEGLSADSEPSPARMAEIIDMAREYDIRIIFYEDLSNPKVAQAIAAETGAEASVLSPIEGLTDEDRENGEDYFSLMYRNLDALKEALL